VRPRSIGARSGDWRSAGIKGMAWGRYQAWRRCEVEGRAGWRRQGSRPVVTGVSRKIVNSDWWEVDEGHLPVPYRSDGSLKNRLTYLFLVDCYLRYHHMWWCAGGVPAFPVLIYYKIIRSRI